MSETEGVSFADIEPLQPPQPTARPNFFLNASNRSTSRGAQAAKINTTLILDPKTKDKLGQQPRTHEEISPLDSGLLSQPTLQSSLAVKNQLIALHELKITEDARRMRIPKETIHSVQNKLTRILNASSKTAEFSDLVPLTSTTKESQPKKIPRAKISVDETWKAAKGNTRPSDYLKNNQEDQVVDSISVPYPQLSYSLKTKPHQPASLNQSYKSISKAAVYNPVLSISSMELNFEDSHCADFFERPIRIRDFQ
ncbi:hypothetical protein BDR26DRAFT_1012676 [Obelidium mucronatum]|nr:hypothetical protein BDR26DRAFT_1012676 [Obelidium mucronatum]